MYDIILDKLISFSWVGSLNKDIYHLINNQSPIIQSGKIIPDNENPSHRHSGTFMF